MTKTRIIHGLIIKKEFLDMILSGQKTWEIRGSATSRRGPIALIQSQSGLVVGTCEVVGVEGPLTLATLKANHRKTGFRPTSLYYRKTYAWVLRNARRLPQPIPYRHPAGAVIWVKLGEGVTRRLMTIA